MTKTIIVAYCVLHGDRSEHSPTVTGRPMCDYMLSWAPDVRCELPLVLTSRDSEIPLGETKAVNE